MDDIDRKRLIKEYYSKRASDYDRQKSRTWKSTQGFGNEIFKEILRELRNFQNKSLLEVGIGSGRNAKPILENSNTRFVGLDLSRAMLEQAKIKLNAQKENLDLVLGDAENLPFSGETFDGILCMSTMHYFSNQEKTLEDFRHRLKKKGILIYGDLSIHESDDKGFFETLERTISKAHARYYKASGIKRLIERSGFHKVKMKTIGYQKSYEALVEDKARYFDVSSKALQQVVDKADLKSRRLYSLTHDGMTLFYTIATATKENA